jgi:hypothetical protein
MLYGIRSFYRFYLGYFFNPHVTMPAPSEPVRASPCRFALKKEAHHSFPMLSSVPLYSLRTQHTHDLSAFLWCLNARRLVTRALKVIKQWLQ